jgi:hypothetical protein
MRRPVIGFRAASRTIVAALPRALEHLTAARRPSESDVDLSRHWIAIGAQVEAWATPDVTIDDLGAVEDGLAEAIYLRSRARRLTS